MPYGEEGEVRARRMTAPRLREMRERGEPIVCLTAYDEPGARFADEAGVDAILVGDSLANVVLGLETTLAIGMPEMTHHLRAVRRGVSRAHLVADMPFGSYQATDVEAVTNAVALMREGADAVKLEGAYPDRVAAIVRAGIPVMGHIGLTPQSVHAFGGFSVQGRDAAAAETLAATARGLEAAGAYAIVLELIPDELARRITGELTIPTIGIGAGDGCSGQIQVMHDVLGYSPKPLRHARPYGEAHRWIPDAIAAYVRGVRGE